MTREQFRQQLEHTFSDAFAVSYFDRSEFRDGSPATLRPWSFTAERKFKDEAASLLKREGVKLLPPDPEHLKPTDRQGEYANGERPQREATPTGKGGRRS